MSTAPAALIDATADIPAFTFAGTTHAAKVVSCYDGDTFEAVMYLGDKLWKFDCRMCGYDSPEMKPLKTLANRDAEKIAALRAKIALLSFVCDGIEPTRPYTNKELNELIKRNKKVIELDCKEFDKYGRLLVEIKIPLVEGMDVGSPGIFATTTTTATTATTTTTTTTTTTVNEWMIANNYGYKYTGGSKKAFV